MQLPQNTKPALIIGNGPSVDKIDPRTLSQFTTYGCNHIVRKFEHWGQNTDHVLITDSRRLPEIGSAYQNQPTSLWIGDERYRTPPQPYIRRIAGRDFNPIHQLFKPRFRKVRLFSRIPCPNFFRAFVFDKSRFSFDPVEGFNFGQSVTLSAIQLAIAHGHKIICLTGMETSYNTPKDYFAGMTSSISFVNDVFIANPRRWMEPLLVLLQIQAEPLGVSLIDCTPGGSLKFVAKGELTDSGCGYTIKEHRLS